MPPPDRATSETPVNTEPIALHLSPSTSALPVAGSTPGRREDRIPLYRWTSDALEPLQVTSFSDEGIWERKDLQRLLRDAPDPLEPGLVVIAEEFGYWADAKRRIDLLAIDRSARLVVIELKRTEDGGFEDLQAVRYAAMVAHITSEQVVEAHCRYLQHRIAENKGLPEHIARLASLGRAVTEQDARAHLADMMSIGSEEFTIASAQPRIVLVSAGFAPELTTSVLWLNDQGLDIRCIRLKPYRLEGQRVVLHVEQVIPLPDVNIYMTQWKKKAAEDEIKATAQRREKTIDTLIRTELAQAGDALIFDRRRLPDATADLSSKQFHARFGPDLAAAKNVIWDDDDQPYALSPLTANLRDKNGEQLFPNTLNGYIYWCLASKPEMSLVELAEMAGRQ